MISDVSEAILVKVGSLGQNKERNAAAVTYRVRIIAFLLCLDILAYVDLCFSRDSEQKTTTDRRNPSPSSTSHL